MCGVQVIGNSIAQGGPTYPMHGFGLGMGGKFMGGIGVEWKPAQKLSFMTELRCKPAEKLRAPKHVLRKPFA